MRNIARWLSFTLNLLPVISLMQNLKHPQREISPMISKIYVKHLSNAYKIALIERASPNWRVHFAATSPKKVSVLMELNASLLMDLMSSKLIIRLIHLIKQNLAMLSSRKATASSATDATLSIKSVILKPEVKRTRCSLISDKLSKKDVTKSKADSFLFLKNEARSSSNNTWSINIFIDF